MSRTRRRTEAGRAGPARRAAPRPRAARRRAGMAFACVVVITAAGAGAAFAAAPIIAILHLGGPAVVDARP